MKEKLKSIVVMCISLSFSFLLGELVMRIYYFDELKNIFNTQASIYSYTSTNVDTRQAALQYKLAATVDTALYAIQPSTKTYGVLRQESIGLQGAFKGQMTDDLMKCWNYNFLKKLYSGSNGELTKAMLEGYSDGRVYAFKGYDSSQYPVYRYMLNAMVGGGGNKFNKYGFGGSDIAFRKPDSTIRIAFLGGSTTQQSGYEFAYPDYIEAWFNTWAKANGYHVKFEVINAGRVAQRSMDFAAIMRYEVAPLQPDIVMYYEGRNQFNPARVMHYTAVMNNWYNPLYFLLSHSVLAQATCAAFNLKPYMLIENQKAEYAINWPKGLNVERPNVYSDSLPLNLGQIVCDLDTIRCIAGRNNATMFLSSFPMLVNDIIMEDKDYAVIYGYWLNSFPRLRLRTIDTLSKFENRVYAQYAAHHGIVYMDVASALLAQPDMFIDGIHLNEQGLKYQAWVVFNNMLPTVKGMLDRGDLPCKRREGEEQHPYVKDDFFMLDVDTLRYNK